MSVGINLLTYTTLLTSLTQKNSGGVKALV